MTLPFDLAFGFHWKIAGKTSKENLKQKVKQNLQHFYALMQHTQHCAAARRAHKK
jgi:hypothetical protein